MDLKHMVQAHRWCHLPNHWRCTLGCLWIHLLLRQNHCRRCSLCLSPTPSSLSVATMVSMVSILTVSCTEEIPNIGRILTTDHQATNLLNVLPCILHTCDWMFPALRRGQVGSWSPQQISLSPGGPLGYRMQRQRDRVVLTRLAPVRQSAAHMSGVRPVSAAGAFTSACPFSAR